MKTEYKLSIIIVSWNAKDYLIKCLKSAIADINKIPTEIIVVDNCSSDGSADAVEEQFPEVKLIRNKQNLGFAKANNIGIKSCTGEYVCLMNSDIVVMKDCFPQLIEYMDSNSNVGVLAPKTLNADGTLQRSCFSLPSIWNSLSRVFALDSIFPWSRLFGSRLMTYWAHDEIRTVEALNGCFLIVSRKALEEVGLLDEGFFFYGEDLDWCKRFGDCGWDVVYYPKAEAIHFGGASSSNAPIRYAIEMNKADLQYWRKHKRLSGELAYFLILLLHHSLRLIGYAPLCLLNRSLRGNTTYKLKRSFECLRWLLTRYSVRAVSDK
jgi:GT2 family glycosyltransferase